MARLSGVEGRLFRPLVIAYITAVALSLLVAMTLTPALCAYLLGRRKLLEKKTGSENRCRDLRSD